MFVRLDRFKFSVFSHRAMVNGVQQNHIGVPLKQNGKRVSKVKNKVLSATGTTALQSYETFCGC